MRVSENMSSSTESQISSSCYENGLKKGPWTVEEDTLLIHSISLHGEGRWNLLALRAGLNRTGKSCRLRWLNYLKPEVKRGNLSPQEQLLILDLHSRWGNRWSKIAQQLPGRTDNEIKNYWRTRVQKQAKLMNIDTNSTKFKDIIRCFWIPRLLQQINESSSSSSLSIPQLSAPDLPPKEQTKKQELDLDQDDQYCTASSCITQSSESMDNISGGSSDDPFYDIPSWNHDIENRLPPSTSSSQPDFDFQIADYQHSQLYDWMDNYSDAGCGWNFDELWQF